MNARTTYFGKYRGSVFNNVDPKSKGRLQVTVPAVNLQNSLNWATPCVPYAGKDQGLYMIPPKGASIWVEFEGGDINFPIWSGCFWEDGECPAELPTTKMIKTPAGTITFDEVNPQAPVLIETPNGHRVSFTAQGVVVEASAGAKVELDGPKVTINGGALEVV